MGYLILAICIEKESEYESMREKRDLYMSKDNGVFKKRQRFPFNSMSLFKAPRFINAIIFSIEVPTLMCLFYTP